MCFISSSSSCPRHRFTGCEVTEGGGEGRLIEMHPHVRAVDQIQCPVLKEQKSFINIVLDKVVFYPKSRLYFKIYIFFLIEMFYFKLKSGSLYYLQHHGEFTPLFKSAFS